MIFQNGWYVPFDDFFSHLPENLEIKNFGNEARLEALRFCKKKRAVIDIGSHIGISVNHWKTMFSKIYAFEPNKDHFDCLKNNIENSANVTLYNLGLSNIEGVYKGSYRTIKNSGSFQLLDDNYQQPKNTAKARTFVDIEIKKLDSFEFEDVDLIKIDVEGWEYEVLLGAVNTINKHKPVLMIEVLIDNPHKTLKSNYDLKNLENILQTLGYREVAHVKPDDKIFVHYYE